MKEVAASGTLPPNPDEENRRAMFAGCIRQEAFGKLVPQLEANAQYTITIVEYWSKETDDDYAPLKLERFTCRVTAKRIA